MKNFLSLLFGFAALILSSCGAREAQIITTATPIADGEWQCFRREFTLLSPGSAELTIAANCFGLAILNSWPAISQISRSKFCSCS